VETKADWDGEHIETRRRDSCKRGVEKESGNKRTFGRTDEKSEASKKKKKQQKKPTKQKTKAVQKKIPKSGRKEESGFFRSVALWGGEF